MIQKTSFAPSKRPYAIRWSNFTVRDHGRAEVHAVWVGRKNGRTVVCEGFLWDYGKPTVEDFQANFDSRYGGDCRSRWNGSDLWAPGLNPVNHAATAAWLEGIQLALPQVPPEYEGWYSLR